MEYNLTARTDEVTKQFNEIKSEVDTLENKLNEIAIVQSHIVNFAFFHLG